MLFFQQGMKTPRHRLLVGSAAIAACAFLLALAAAGPALGAGWEVRALSVGEPQHSNLLEVSCPSESLCVAAGESGIIASSTNPTGDAGAWRIVRPHDAAVETDSCQQPLFPGEAPFCPERYSHRAVRAISCPSPGLCIAVTFDGYVYSSTDPSGPEASWHVADVDGSERDTHLESVSCPDSGFCVAVSGDRNTAGKVLTSTNPTGPGSAWNVTQLDESLDLTGVSCLSRDLCFAVAGNGRILRSTNPGGGPSAWSEIGTPGGPGDLAAIVCGEAGGFLCLTGNSGGNLLTTTDAAGNASSWGEVNGGASVPITGVACPSSSRCAAVDNNGNVLVSSDPGRFWAISNLIPYSPPGKESTPVFNALFGASCPTVTLCVLVGTMGRVFTNVDPFAAATATAGGGKVAGKGRSRRHLVKRPRTKLLKADGFREITRHRRLRVRFRFYSRSKARGFVCKRDSGHYKRCSSPLRYWVPIGPHLLQVRAIGPTGLRGPAATIRFSAIHNAAFD